MDYWKWMERYYVQCWVPLTTKGACLVDRLGHCWSKGNWLAILMADLRYSVHQLATQTACWKQKAGRWASGWVMLTPKAANSAHHLDDYWSRGNQWDAKMDSLKLMVF